MSRAVCPGYTVSWGREDGQPTGQYHAEVSTVEELDTTLDVIKASGGRHMVDVYRSASGDGHCGLQIGVGHAERSFVFYIGAPAGGWAVDPSLPEWPEDITFDYGGEPTAYHPDETRVTYQQARHAAREYVRTGCRPDVLTWGTRDR